MNQKKSILSTITFLVFLAIIFLILVISIPTLQGSAPASLTTTQGPTPGMTSSFTPGPDLTQTWVAIPTYKAHINETVLAYTPPPEVNTPVYLPTGIYDDQRVKISASLLFMDAQNAWYGLGDGYSFALYAGALQSDPDQGVLILDMVSPEGGGYSQYVTSSKHGALRIVSNTQNNRFTLTAADGTVFYFDLPTRQFVASLTEVAPTVTPSPLPSPTPLPTPSPTLLPYPLPALEPTHLPYPLPTPPDTVVP
jgi:hypothetical protein